MKKLIVLGILMACSGGSGGGGTATVDTLSSLDGLRQLVPAEEITRSGRHSDPNPLSGQHTTPIPFLSDSAVLKAGSNLDPAKEATLLAKAKEAIDLNELKGYFKHNKTSGKVEARWTADTTVTPEELDIIEETPTKLRFKKDYGTNGDMIIEIENEGNNRFRAFIEIKPKTNKIMAYKESSADGFVIGSETPEGAVQMTSFALEPNYKFKLDENSNNNTKKEQEFKPATDMAGLIAAKQQAVQNQAWQEPPVIVRQNASQDPLDTNAENEIIASVRSSVIEKIIGLTQIAFDEENQACALTLDSGIYEGTFKRRDNMIRMEFSTFLPGLRMKVWAYKGGDNFTIKLRITPDEDKRIAHNSQDMAIHKFMSVNETEDEGKVMEIIAKMEIITTN